MQGRTRLPGKEFLLDAQFQGAFNQRQPCMPPERLDELTQYGSVNFFLQRLRRIL